MSEKTQSTAYPLRMPPGLREAVEDAARDNKRSLNAEIVTRLELSLIDDDRSTQFISADKARELVTLADLNISKKIHDKTQRAIAQTALAGHSQAFVSLVEFGLDADNPEHVEMLSQIKARLERSGYSLAGTEFTALLIDFS